MPADASKPLTVTVCTGTTCSLMDGAALLEASPLRARRAHRRP